MYVSFALLFVPVTALSYYVLPEGILRGKDPIIRALRFSPIPAYNAAAWLGSRTALPRGEQDTRVPASAPSLTETGRDEICRPPHESSRTWSPAY